MTNAAREPGTGARLLIDFAPLLIFFGVNAFAPVAESLKIFYATGAFMAAMFAAMLFSQIRYRHISPMLWFSGAMVLILGGVTLWLHDENFIKMKPTIVYVTIGAVLLFGLRTGRNLLQTVLGSAYPGLSPDGWRKLTRNWVWFFFLMAVVNEAVWRSTTTDFWVGFKLWFFLPATFLFALANVPMLMRYGLAVGQDQDPPIPPTQ